MLVSFRPPSFLSEFLDDCFYISGLLVLGILGGLPEFETEWLVGGSIDVWFYLLSEDYVFLFWPSLF